MKRIKEFLKAPDSFWYFIPQNIFGKIGGLEFLLQCNYSESCLNYLLLKLSYFHKQVLTAARLCFTHNFSPHKTIKWNNENITPKNKSLYLQHWIDRNIIVVTDLQNNEAQLLSYKEFLQTKVFPVSYKE